MQNTKAKDQYKSLPVFIFINEFFQEFFRGIKTKSFPWTVCLGVAAAFFIVFSLRLDAFFWKWCHVSKLYPFHPILYWAYVAIYATSGFWIWTMGRVVSRRILIKKLSSVFRNAGLQTKMGRLPGFIADEKMDTHSRKLVLSSAGLPEAEFKKAKPYLESELQVFIDQINARVERGIVELIYAHETLPDQVPFNPDEKFGPLQFLVGLTRSTPVYVSLRDVPHILIGGYTNSGKSSLLRQILVTLTLNNPGVEFVLIDLKGGLEFLMFEGLPGVRVYTDVTAAIEGLKYAEAQLDKRMQLLRANKVSELDAYFKKPESERVFTREWPKGKRLSRQVVVIDEAAELFLAGARCVAKDAQVARRLASKIAALGRAVGIHLIVATQRPDRNAVDPLIKTNLQGRICFQMADNASSMTILDSVRAADLPSIKGRAIWKSGLDLTEIQIPWLDREQAEALLKGKAQKHAREDDLGPLTAVQNTGLNLPQVKDEIAVYDEAQKKEGSMTSAQAESLDGAVE